MERRRLIHVIATARDGTLSALDAARRLGAEQDANLVLLVPHIVPFVPTNGAIEDTAALTEMYRTLASQAGVDVTVRVCLCRRPEDVCSSLLVEPTTIVVGGRRRRWWPTPAERLARRLSRTHQVIFADVAEACS